MSDKLNFLFFILLWKNESAGIKYEYFYNLIGVDLPNIILKA